MYFKIHIAKEFLRILPKISDADAWWGTILFFFWIHRLTFVCSKWIGV